MKILLIANTGLVFLQQLAMIVFFTLLLGCNRTLIPDAKLRDTFYANREGFDRLLSMSQQDRALVRVTFDLTLTQTDTGVKKNVGLSEERWEEYRVLFRKLGLAGGLERPEALRSAVLFYAHCTGSAIDADCKGLAYSEKPLSPVATSLDKPRPGDVFEQVCPNWYLFRWVE